LAESFILLKSRFLGFRCFGDYKARVNCKSGSLRARDVLISYDSNGLNEVALLNAGIFLVLARPSSSRDIARIKSLF
jgi:hypothetical protein